MTLYPHFSSLTRKKAGVTAPTTSAVARFGPGLAAINRREEDVARQVCPSPPPNVIELPQLVGYLHRLTAWVLGYHYCKGGWCYKYPPK
jgi:hypothetical protein